MRGGPLSPLSAGGILPRVILSGQWSSPRNAVRRLFASPPRWTRDTVRHVSVALSFVSAVCASHAYGNDASWRAPRAALPPASVSFELALPVERSISFGKPNDGRVHNGVRLPESDAIRVLDDIRSRDTAWGTTQIIELLVDAAARTREQWPDTTIGVGNIGHRSGGPIRWSRSHQNGRDADVSFVFVDERGRFVQAPFLYHVGPDLTVRERPDWRFDVARNWTLVASLLDSPRATIDWIFVSNPIREALLHHAIEQGEPAELVVRAAARLRQPGDSLPHDDHFHIRVICDDVDRYHGCTSYGPIRSDAGWDHEAFEARLEALLHCAAHAPAALADGCWNQLDALQTRESSAFLAERLPDLPSALADRLLTHLEREGTVHAGVPLLHGGERVPAALRPRVAALAARLLADARPEPLCAYLDTAHLDADGADALERALLGVLLPTCAVPRIAERVRRGTTVDRERALQALRRATFTTDEEVGREGEDAWLTRLVGHETPDREPWLVARLERALGLAELPAAEELFELWRANPDHQDLIEAALSHRLDGTRPSSRDARPARQRFWEHRLRYARAEAGWRHRLHERDSRMDDGPPPAPR
jgi:penicillin-insensitive murein endopeptidase